MVIKVVVMKAMAGVCGKSNVSITENQTAVEKKDIGMNTAMGSATDSEMRCFHPVSVCRRHLNG